MNSICSFSEILFNQINNVLFKFFDSGSTARDPEFKVVKFALKKDAKQLYYSLKFWSMFSEVQNSEIEFSKKIKFLLHS